MRRSVGAIVGACIALTAIVPASSGVEAESSRTVRSFLDGKQDIRYANPDVTISKQWKNGLDVRSVTAEQLNGRDASVTIGTRGGPPGNSPSYRYTYIAMLRETGRDPNIYIRISDIHNRRASVSAYWNDGSHTECSVPVQRTNEGRTRTVVLPYRCSWWKISRITVDNGMLPRCCGTDFFKAHDTRTAPARLAWDDQL